MIGGRRSVRGLVGAVGAIAAWAVLAMGSPIAASVPIGEGDIPQVVSTGRAEGDVAFGDARHGWRVGAGGLILATTDGGASWVRQVSPTTGSLTAIDAVSATHAWAVGRGGLLLRTVDGGSTWTRIQLDSEKDLRGVDFVDAQRGWVIEWYGAVRATADGGITWTEQTTGFRPFAALSFVDANHGFVGGGLDNGRFIWRTTDGGRSWQEVLGLPAPTSGIRALDFADARRGIAVGTNGFSFRTADGGTTWTETSTGIGVDFTGIAMVDPSNAIAVGTGRFGQAPVVPRAYRTSDAGASWVAIPTGPRGDLAAIAARPGGGFAVAAPGASTFSSSDGTTWAAPVDEARSPSTLRGLSTSGSHVVAVGDGGSVRTSRDGGVRWAESAMPVPADLRAVDSIDAKIWAVGSLRDDVVGIVHPVVLHSTDDGGSWTPIGTGLPAARRLNAVRFVDPLRGWVVGAGPAGSGAGFIAATTDGGHTWSVVAQTGPRELTSLEVIDDRLWAVGPKAYVRSDDGGETWVVAAEGTDVPIPAPSLASIDFIDGVHGWIGAADRILATSDGGITWTQLENPFGASLLHVRFTNQLEGWATGHDGSLRRTIDGGTTWSSRWIPSTRASDELTSLTIDGSGALWVTLASTVAVVPTRRPSAVELRANAPTGAKRTVTAEVTGLDTGSIESAPATPTGSVRFVQGGTVLATVPLTAAGRASVEVSSAPTAGPVVASYLGDSAFGPAPSPALLVAVRPAWYPEPSASAFVDAVNRGLRGTTLTPAQRSAEAARITTSAAARAYVADRLGDRYCAGSVGPIFRLYSGFFTRPPDTSGLTYWVGRARTGTPLTAAAAAFAGSSEFRRTYGSLSDGAYVDLVYRNVLGRQPDAGGRAFWINRLRSGTSRGAVMTSFSESSENQRKTANAVAVTSLALCLRSRAATPLELTGGANALANGVPLTTLVAEVLATGQIRPPAPD